MSDFPGFFKPVSDSLAGYTENARVRGVFRRDDDGAVSEIAGNETHGAVLRMLRALQREFAFVKNEGDVEIRYLFSRVDDDAASGADGKFFKRAVVGDESERRPFSIDDTDNGARDGNVVGTSSDGNF